MRPDFNARLHRTIAMHHTAASAQLLPFSLACVLSQRNVSSEAKTFVRSFKTYDGILLYTYKSKKMGL